MRAKEFINEESGRKPLRKSVSQSMPNMTSSGFLDNNSHPYLAYRFGVALASSPDTEHIYKKGPIGSDFVMADYTDAETEIRKGAERAMGVHGSRTTGKGSKELEGGIINKVSPTAKPKRNRYGV